jgi:cellulose synthase operon protein YhjU
MLPWNLYFLIKFIFIATGILQFEPVWNLLLFSLLLATNPLKTRNPLSMGSIRDLVFLPIAIALFLHEAGLVVSWALLGQIKLLFGFSAEYLAELIRRSIAPWMAWSALSLVLAARIINRYVRLSTWVLSTLVILTIAQVLPALLNQDNPQIAENRINTRINLSPAELLALGPQEFQLLRQARQSELNNLERNQETNGGNTPDSVIKQFFKAQEAFTPKRLAGFSNTSQPDFDVLILQICSLSWADLHAARQAQHPVIQNVDFIFEDFNSATSYSGPAAIRLLRGRCGQKTHAKLYEPEQDKCLLFKELRDAGFSVEMLLNHDGKFDNFTNTVRENLGNPAEQPVAQQDIPLGVWGFDGSKIGRDGDALRNWWNKRLEHNKPSVALYYNTITLHDGNRLPNNNQSSLNSYPIRLERLLNDLQSLLSEIQRSKHKALVVVIPEHGAGLTGEYGQLVGLRELPTPALTKVPVFGYWISPTRKNPNTPGQIAIRQPTSYQAFNELLNRWFALSPEQRDDAQWPTLVANLPSTHYLAQQGNITVLEHKSAYWMQVPGVDWKNLGPVKSESRKQP